MRLIADYFEPRRRARALAIFSLGVPIGLSLGTLLGAYIAHAISWRAAFFTMGVAGLILAPIMLFVVRDSRAARHVGRRRRSARSSRCSRESRSSG